MGIILMLQEKDNQRIEQLQKDLSIYNKVNVIRAGLLLLEKEAESEKRIKRWKHATKLVVKSSEEANKAFQKHSKMKSE